jgi:hypothetical protein
VSGGEPVPFDPPPGVLHATRDVPEQIPGHRILTIEPTQFTRSDGVVMVKLPSGNWMIRRGASCFFFDRTKNWDDCWVFMAAKGIEDLEKFSMSLGEAYRFLEVIPEEVRTGVRQAARKSS